MKNKTSSIIFISLLFSSSIVFGEGPVEILKGGKGTWTATNFSEDVLSNSSDLKGARQKVERAKAQLSQAKIAMMPTLVLLARYTRLSETNNDPLFETQANPNTQALVGGVDDPEAQQLWIDLGQQNAALSQASIAVPENHFAFDAELRLPLSDWFTSLGPTKNALVSRVRSERAAIQATENGLRFRARATFYSLIQKRTLVSLEEERLKDAHEKLRSIKAALNAGAAKRSDFQRLQSFVYQVEASLSSARADEIIALENVRALSGKEDEYLTGEDILADLELVTVDANSLEKGARSKRPELRAMYEAKASLGHFASSTKGSRWPKLDVVGKATLANPNLRFTPAKDGFETTWEASAVVSWSPNLLFLNKAKGSAIDAQVVELEAQEEAFLKTLRSDIAGTLAKDKSNLEVILSAKKAVDALTKVYQSRQVEFEAGTITLTDLLSAETELKEARIGWINANIQARVTRSKLTWLSGGAIPAP